MNPSQVFSRVWSAFDDGEIMIVCAWCDRLQLDGTWVRPPRAAIAAVDAQRAFSHSICEECAQAVAASGAELERRPIRDQAWRSSVTPQRRHRRSDARGMDDDRPPICPRCGVTMVPAALSADEHGDGDWACLECEELGEEG